MSTTATPLRIEPVDGLDSIKTEWSDLAESSRNIFATWEWTSLWWSHFGHERELAVAAALDDGDRIAAVLPLYFWIKRPGRILRFLGHGASDQLGPICHPNERGAAAGALITYLETNRRRWDVLLAEHLPSDEDWRDALGATLLRTESNPVLHDDGGGWDGFLASRSSNFRQQVGRRERNLHRRHEVQFRLADDPARLEEDLNTLFALHSARWSRGTPLSAAPARPSIGTSQPAPSSAAGCGCGFSSSTGSQ